MAKLGGTVQVEFRVNTADAKRRLEELRQVLEPFKDEISPELANALERWVHSLIKVSI